MARAMTGLEKNHVSAQATTAVPDAPFVSLQHTGTEFTWAADGECRIEWVDGRGSDFMGEPLAGLKWAQIAAVHPDDCGTVERQWRDAVSSGTAYESEHRLRGRNGEFRWFAARAFPLRNRSGESVRWFGSSADIHEIKLAEQAFRETELRIDAALGLVRSPEEDSVDLELAHLLDVRAIRPILESLYSLTKMSILIQDAHGTDLVGTGWQRICADLHRRNKETCQQCVESDRLLLEGVPPGQARIKECKNGLWDVGTPIIDNGRQLGSIFSGQFLFEGDEPDRELFRARARYSGFDEEDYMSALDEVPRLSRELVEEGMSLLPKLANLVAELCYDHIKIDRSLAKSSALADSLRMQRASANDVEGIAKIGSWYLEPESQRVQLSDEACRILDVPKNTQLTLDQSSMMVHPQHRQQVLDAVKGCESDSLQIELRVVAGQDARNLRAHIWLERDQDGRLVGSRGLIQDCAS